MKLAEALIVRAEIQDRLKNLEGRACLAARHQEGDEVAEDAAALVAEALRVHAELAELVARINQTNATHRLANGLTITQAIARRGMLGKQQVFLRTVADAAMGIEENYGRYSRSTNVRETRTELRWIAAVPVVTLREQRDSVAQERRILDTMIQEANWTVELVD